MRTLELAVITTVRFVCRRRRSSRRVSSLVTVTAPPPGTTTTWYGDRKRRRGSQRTRLWRRQRRAASLRQPRDPAQRSFRQLVASCFTSLSLLRDSACRGAIAPACRIGPRFSGLHASVRSVPSAALLASVSPCAARGDGHSPSVGLPTRTDPQNKAGSRPREGSAGSTHVLQQHDQRVDRPAPRGAEAPGHLRDGAGGPPVGGSPAVGRGRRGGGRGGRRGAVRGRRLRRAADSGPAPLRRRPLLCELGPRSLRSVMRASPIRPIKQNGDGLRDSYAVPGERRGGKRRGPTDQQAGIDVRPPGGRGRGRRRAVHGGRGRERRD